MFSYADKLRAVELYFKYGKKASRVFQWQRIIRLVRSGSPAAQFGRKTKIVLCDKNGNRSLRTLVIHGARISDAMREKT